MSYNAAVHLSTRKSAHFFDVENGFKVFVDVIYEESINLCQLIG